MCTILFSCTIKALISVSHTSIWIKCICKLY
nr:MAG TPA: hypothetical protein [Caudoviricetes sp.]